MASYGILRLIKAVDTLFKLLLRFLKPEFRSDHATSSSQHRRYNDLVNNGDPKTLSNKILVFDLEGALLKSSSLFPYFMLVACEAGGLLRAFTLLLSYPLVSLVGKEKGLKLMVFISFVGIKKEKFNIGTAVLPKWLLGDIGSEGFEVVMSSESKIGVTELPRIMVECFLKDFLGVKSIVGRELKVVHGYYVGLMEEKRKDFSDEVLQLEGNSASSIVGFWNFSKPFPPQLLPLCKEIYLVTEAEKKSWQLLSRTRFPRPLIFHDGRLAFRPTPFSALAMFVWLPYGIILTVFRIIVGILLPYSISAPILAFSGTRHTVSNSQTTKNTNERPKGMLYVCNHRTVVDAVYVSASIKKNVASVSYSMSRVSEIMSPIRSARLTRNRDKDRELMVKFLNKGDLVVCAEGTTCREPYLLRFSPLFAELTEAVIPVAIDVRATMFYGSTAGGLKCLDPFCHFLNPYPTYIIRILDKLSTSNACKTGEQASIDVANTVQEQIAKALAFECTNLRRKDKYMILAGNEGIA